MRSLLIYLHLSVQFCVNYFIPLVLKTIWIYCISWGGGLHFFVCFSTFNLLILTSLYVQIFQTPFTLFFFPYKQKSWNEQSYCQCTNSSRQIVKSLVIKELYYADQLQQRQQKIFISQMLSFQLNPINLPSPCENPHYFSSKPIVLLTLREILQFLRVFPSFILSTIVYN